MKTKKELMEIWRRKEKTSRDFWRYNSLSLKEKTCLFDILSSKGLKKIKLKGGKS